MFKRPPHLDLERGRFCWARETTTGGTGLTSPSGLGLSGPISREQEQGLKAWQPSGGGLALHQGQPPNKLSTYELNVRILYVERQRFRLEFDRYLQGPKEANAIQAILPGGLMLQDPIIDGSNEPSGGWLLIEVEQYELPIELPASLNGWQRK